MKNKLNLNQAANNLRTSDKISIILKQDANFDQQLAAASLYLTLNQDKKAFLYGVEKIENPTIAGLNQLKTNMGYQNLRISFEYIEAAVHNVSYHIDEKNNKFHLTIKPQAGHEPLPKETVNIEYAGSDADLIILFGIEKLDELQQLYFDYKDLYQDVELLSIADFQPDFSAHHLDSSAFSSQCEAVFYLLNSLDINLNSEAATNLLAGIQHETDNFIDASATADTFEAVAKLLRAGAQRKAGSFILNKKNNKPTEKLADNNNAKINDKKFEESGEHEIKKDEEEEKVNNNAHQNNFEIPNKAFKTNN